MADISTRGAPAGPEVRAFPAEYEVRMLAGTRAEVTGYASTFEQPYTMYDQFGSYDETVRTGAFTKTIAEGADVAYLTNHGGLTLARTTNGALKLAEDTHGLHSVAMLNLDRSDARDLVIAIEDRAVTEMSFGFRVVRQDWNKPTYSERSLIELNLNRGDVSAVNYGANPNTVVSASRAFRNLNAARLHRIALEVSEARVGKAISSANADVLAKVLELLAAADDAVDQAQPMLAAVLGVPNPDADDADADENENEAAADDAARAAAQIEMIRRKHLLEGERRRSA